MAIAALVACGGGGGSTAPEMYCGDGEDDDGDGVTDCADDDCAEDPLCAFEDCSNGLDDDADGQTDCDDDDCWDDAACYQVDDATDLPEPDGDPSVDIDKIRATLVNRTATFFATFDGPWPPPTTAYSWFIYFEIDNDGNTPVAGVTVERHMGAEATVPAGGIPAANITVRQTPVGIWARITGVPATGEKYYIESGIQESNPGTRVTDTVVGAPAPLP